MKKKRIPYLKRPKITDVSAGRRLLSYGIDIVVSYIIAEIIIWLARSIFHVSLDAQLSLLMLAYFVIAPVVAGGTTCGKWLMHSKIVANDGTSAPRWRILLRVGSLWAWLTIIPAIINWFLSYLASRGIVDGQNLTVAIILYAAWALASSILLLGAFFRLPAFYETLSKTKLVSTERRGGHSSRH